MNSSAFRVVSLVCLLVSLPMSTLCAQAQDVSARLSTGVQFSSGKYGGSEDIEDTYIPLTLSVDRGRIGYRITVPYLSVDAPLQTTTSDPAAAASERNTESGVGDVVGSITVYDVVSNRARGYAMDITGKIKFATADDNAGLGTGEHDYSARADFYKFLEKFTLVASAGYTVRGDPTGIDLENVALASVGAITRTGSRSRVGFFYDYRQSAFADGEPIREVTGFFSTRISDAWRLQFYVVNGQSDSSPDWGGGVAIKVAL